MTALIAAAATFVLSHLILSSNPVRGPVSARLGAKGFLALYSIVALASLVWMVMAFGAAPYVETWFAPVWIKHLPAGIMPIAFLFIVCAYTSPNPSIIGAGAGWADRAPAGILAVTRHPMAWGIGLWAATHALAGGGMARLVLFTAVGALGFLGAWHQDHRKAQQLGPAWETFRSKTSFVPFVAIASGRATLRFADIGVWRIAVAVALAAGAMAAHEWVVGWSPLPLSR